METLNTVNPFLAYNRFQKWRESEAQKCTVKINHPNMEIKGFVVHEELVTDYVAFLGVPYARPPFGPLRFEPPQPYIPKIGPRSIIKLGARETEKFKAYEESEPCLQVLQDCTIGSEDCLYMNIFTPVKPKLIRKLLPVLVYFHGGAFNHGSGNLSAGVIPNYIVLENLIFISVNYRLGVLGFLNMRSENCRGNAGLKDQVMALEWIKDNIRKFKGNPNNVTIAGHSSGGSCVNFHMISPLSKGLFHKAIVMGGGVYCPWGFGGHAKEVMQLFKKEMGKENETRHVVVEALKGETAEDLLDLSLTVARKNISLEPKRGVVFLRPSVECSEKNAFLPDSIENLMQRATPVPTIAGITKQEGYMYFRGEPQDHVALVRDPETFFDFVKQNFRWGDASVEENVDTLKNMYFPNENAMNDDEIKEHLATMITDIFFRRFYDNFRIGQLMKSASPPLYVYEFDYFTGRPIIPFPNIQNIGEPQRPVVVPGAAEHGDDMNFLFRPGTISNRVQLSPERRRRLLARNIVRVIDHMTTLCSSFCRNGVPKSILQPNLNWVRHREDDPHYLHIGLSLTMRNGRLNEQRWADINGICETASVIQSLATTPQTPHSLGSWDPERHVDEDLV